MRFFGKSKGKKYHSRMIQVDTYEFDEMRLLVEGSITDHRCCEYQSALTGMKRMPGVKHKMVIHLLVNKTTLEIEDLEIKMPVAPLEQCSEILNLMDPIRGLRITGGFTSKIKALFGGTKGCIHIIDLLSSMASSTIQGLMYYIRSESLMSKSEISTLLEDSCWPLRSGGPYIKSSTKNRSLAKKQNA